MIQVSKYLKQEESKLVANAALILHIDLTKYDVGDDLIIDEEDDNIWAKGLVSTITIEDTQETFYCILDYPINLNIVNIKSDKENIFLKYEMGDTILSVSMESGEIREQVFYVKRLISGNEVFKDIDHLMLKLYNVYGGISDMDMVHMEVLLSQCLRDKDFPALPSRIGNHPEEPILFDVKKNVFSTSFLQGLAFENVGAAIRVGLTSDYELEESILEKILLGNLVEEE